MSPKKLIILSGVPGAGKTTYIKNNYPNALVCSVDHYFTNSDGSYKYDRSKSAEYHRRCYRKAQKAMQRSVPCVAIDNCNISEAARNMYNFLAKLYGYKKELIVLEVDPQLAYQRCVHGVPLSAIEAMAKQLQKISNK